MIQDSESVVSKEEGIEFAKQNGCLFIECSAKTRLNVEQCFEELLLKVLCEQQSMVFFRHLIPLNYLCIQG
jgi:GTPase SAR1 family protein